MCIFSYACIFVFLLLWSWPRPMTLIHELDLNILKMYPGTKNKVSRSPLLKVRAWTTQRHTHTQTHMDRTVQRYYHSHIRGWQKFNIFWEVDTLPLTPSMSRPCPQMDCWLYTWFNPVHWTDMLWTTKCRRRCTDLFKTFQLYNHDIRHRRQTQWLDCSRLMLTTRWTVPTVTSAQLQLPDHNHGHRSWAMQRSWRVVYRRSHPKFWNPKNSCT